MSFSAFINRNSLINIIIITASIYLGFEVSYYFFLLWPAILLLDDLLVYSFGVSLFDPSIRIKSGYQFSHYMLNNISNDGRDLGFNLYNKDVTKTKEQAQIDKWDFMIKELRLKPGDSLIDIGCGYGDWLNYAKTKGINVIGVNIAPEQGQTAKKNFGIDVICIDWKDIANHSTLKEKLYGKFDAVTFMDTVEHYVPFKYGSNLEMQEKIYTDMFTFASNLLKKDSSSKRVFISLIHRIKEMKKIKEYFNCYLLDKYHSGCYPFGDDGLTKWITPYFKEINRSDHTEDYRLTSVKDRDHFGAPRITWNLKRILILPVLFLTDPGHLHKWLDIKLDTWMWWHFGDDAYNMNYDNDYQKKLRRVTLWWITLEKK